MRRLVGWLRGRWPGWKAYWMERGVVPRWQYLLVYVVIVAAGAGGLLKIGGAVNQIQANRVELCRESNQRHDATIAVLNAALRDLPPRERARARANKRQTVAFINALAPHRNCEQALK